LDKKFNSLIVLSLIIHFLAIFFFLNLLFSKRINLIYNEEKRVTLSVKKVSKKTLLKNLENKNHPYNLKNYNIRRFQENINKKIKIENDIKLNVKNSATLYQYSNINRKDVKLDEVDLLKDESFAKKFIGKEEIRDSNEYLNFTRGDKRTLLEDYKDELSILNFEFAINCKLKIEIDNEGSVVNVSVLESTGDVAKDTKIIAVIYKWKFDESTKILTEATVQLKYLIR